ncbi:hypothetical protein GHT06_019840 [Daphnia sinensis]|uniref:Uncharacterized protein n=1 Tax=Daphnia sinensis TaxID=1820382 RepID=A0AAD5PPQ2_9CRUS|nr:hypothetical protein GHT06_019840 [Daphnia sinensis]
MTVSLLAVSDVFDILTSTSNTCLEIIKMRYCGISKLVAYVLFTVILAVTIAEEIGEDVAESWESRSPRCEHHNHDVKRTTKWLGKLKRTKTQYASSKPHSRPKSHYGQPHTHNRPPKPQYIPPATNFRIPPYNPPASYPAPHFSQSTVQNPNSLPQASYPPQQNPNYLPQTSYPTQTNPNSNPQSVSYNPPAHVSPAPTEAPPYPPPSYNNAPYPQSPEEFEDLSLPMSVYIPPAQVHNPPGPYTPAQAPVAVSYDPPATPHTEAPNYFAPAHTSPAHTEATSLPPSYTEAPSPHVYSPAPPAYDPPAASETEAPYFPSSSQVPVYDPPTTYPPPASTEHSVYSQPSYAQYDEAYSPPVPTGSTPEPYNLPAVTENTPGPYVPPQQHQNTPVSYALPHPPSVDSASYSPPASTETPDYFPSSYDDASYSHSYNPPEQDKNTELSYSFPHPPSSDSASYYPTASTEAPDYFPPSYSDAPYSGSYHPPEDTHVSSTFPHPSPNSDPYYPPVSTKAPDYFPPSYDESPYLDYYNPPASMYNVLPTSYSSPSFSSSNFPSYSFPSFMESVDRSPLGYKDVRYPTTSDRASAYNPSHENEEFFQSGKFPRFNEFLQQMLRGKM